MFERLEAEVFAETGDVRFRGVTGHLVFKCESIFPACRIVEDEYTVLAVVIFRQEGSAFDDVDSHEFREVICNRITFEIDVLSVPLTAPAHSFFCQELARRPCHVLDLRICLHPFFHSLGVVSDVICRMNIKQLFLVKAHVEIYHVPALYRYERGTDDQDHRYHELHADEGIAERLSGLRRTERPFQDHCRFEGRDVKGRVEACDDRNRDGNDYGPYGHAYVHGEGAVGGDEMHKLAHVEDHNQGECEYKCKEYEPDAFGYRAKDQVSAGASKDFFRVDSPYAFGD